MPFKEPDLSGSDHSIAGDEAKNEVSVRIPMRGLKKVKTMVTSR
jgi:hypothetical protein